MKKIIFISFIFIAIISCKNSQSDKKTDDSAVIAAVTPIPDSIRNIVDSVVIKLAIKNKCRMTCKVANDSGAAYYVGYDGREGKAITDFSGSIDIGSCTKMYTAASILQLIEKGKFSLQDKLTSVLPNDTLFKNLLVINGKNYIDSVKVINLLNHSSGFPEYFLEGDDDKEFSLHGDSTLRFTPYELITMAKGHVIKPFIPGSEFRYCNVNYILLGLIIEKYSGMTYHEYVQKNIIDPLGLKHTYFASVNPPAKRADGHYKGKISVMPATLAGAAGEIISDLDDMQKFISEWNKGKLFSDTATINKLKTEHFMTMEGTIKYGMGVVNLMNFSLGHAGQTFGFQSFTGVLNNNFTFAFGIDDAAVSGWDPAISLSFSLQ